MSRRNARETRQTELGTEQRCSRCRYWWPLDDEFWLRCAKCPYGFQGHCKACHCAMPSQLARYGRAPRLGGYGL